MKNLSLKNLKFHEDMSEETPCFSADLYENGKLMAHVSNRGHGGCNDYQPAKGKTWKDIQHLTDMNTDCDIMGLAEELNVVQKNQTKALVIKKGEEMFLIKYKSSFAQLRKANPNSFSGWINQQIKRQLDQGYEVLNTNLPERTV